MAQQRPHLDSVPYWATLQARGPRASAKELVIDQLIESLKKLIEQSTQTLGPDAPSTIQLQQQLAAALESRKQSRKVLWIQPTDSAGDNKKE